MKFEAVQILFFGGEFSIYCHPKILLPRQRNVTTSLYWPYTFRTRSRGRA